jgi:hypothetical protein
MNALVFDIETGPLPWEQLAKVYEPPPPLPPWSEDMVKYGNTKDTAKRQEKRTAVYNDYLQQLANEKAKAEEHRLEFVSRAALSPLTGQVLAIGLRRCEQVVVLGADGESEAEMLAEFWGLYTKYKANNGRLVGFNCNHFDVPFLVRRSWWHGVQVPDSVCDRGGRYLCSTFVDLMAMWGGPGNDRVSLDTLCRWFGCGRKPDGEGAASGATFAALWLSGNQESRSAALAYLENDLAMTQALAGKMGVIQ